MVGCDRLRAEIYPPTIAPATSTGAISPLLAASFTWAAACRPAVVVVLSRNAAVAMAPGGAPQKSAPPRPPDKGSFPLDHFKECSDAKAQYMQCLKAHGMRTEVEECRRLSAAYLQCRMDTQLMAPQPINRLGFEEAARQRAAAGPDDGEKRARDGFIAGLPPKQANG